MVHLGRLPVRLLELCVRSVFSDAEEGVERVGALFEEAEEERACYLPKTKAKRTFGRNPSFPSRGAR